MGRKYSIAVLLFSMIWICSCNKEPGTAELPYRFEVPVLLGTHITNYTANEIDYSIDLTVFKGDNSLNEVLEFTDLPLSSFKFEKIGNEKHFIEKIEYIDTLELNTFSTVILIDQSAYPESYLKSDYYNQRFQAFNAFFKNLNGEGKIAFAYYSRTSDTAHHVARFINNDLVEFWDEKTATRLLEITHEQEGSSGLFDAVEQAIKFLAPKNVENKSVTIFMRNKDDGKSNLDLEGIIAMAQINKIKINIIWLKTQYNVDFKTLRQIPTRTGGFTVYMYSIYQSNTIFLSLSKLLKMQTNFYRIYNKMTINSPGSFGISYSSGLTVTYEPKYYLTSSYAPFYLEKP